MQVKIRTQKLETDIHETQQTIRMDYENAVAQLTVSRQSVKAQEENLQLAGTVYTKQPCSMPKNWQTSHLICWKQNRHSVKHKSCILPKLFGTEKPKST